MKKNYPFPKTKFLRKALFIVALFFSLSINAQDTIRCLAIGNSYSQDAVGDYLHAIARAENKILILANLPISSCSLQMHWENAIKNKTAYSCIKFDENGVISVKRDCTFDFAVTSEKWDYISLQQVSSDAGILSTYFPYLPNLVNHIKEKATNPNVQLAFHQTWGYPENSTHPGFAKYGNDAMKMYNDIVETVNTAASQVGIKVIIPSGVAIHDGNKSFGDKVYRDTFHHLSDLGRYIVAP